MRKRITRNARRPPARRFRRGGQGEADRGEGMTADAADGDRGPRGQDADTVSAARRGQVAAGLAAVRARIAAACETAGRDAAEVTLIGVTKTYPAADVRLLAGLGVHDVGENRDQEARAKADACADLPLRWHFIGQMQSNKAASVARYAALVHSVDRASLVRALGAAAIREDRRLDCLVQVSLDTGPEAARRGGAAPADVPALADALAGTPGLRLAGVMAVAPADTRGSEPAAAAAFERLAAIAARLRSAHPDARVVSAGMSADLAAAVRAGATHVRVGTAILGARPPAV